jgi:hypothetical protein
MVGPAMTLRVSGDVEFALVLVSVAVIVTENDPVPVGIPVMLVLRLGPGFIDRPAGSPLALHVQHVAVPSESLALKPAPGYAAVTSPSGSEDGAVIVTCPLATPAHTAASPAATTHLIDKRVMGAPGSG